MSMRSMPARQKGLSKLVLLLIILVVLLLGAGTTLALYFAGVFDGEQVELAEGEEQPAKPLGPPRYLPFEPPLIVNFERNGRMGYLQVNMQMMVRGDGAFEAVMNHLPVLRDAMLMLIGSKTYDQVSTREGKEALREEALMEANRVLDEFGVEHDVEAIYFTGFVMQ